MYWQKIYTHCAICRVPPMIHIIMRPIVLFYVLWQQKKISVLITETRPKKSFFLLFVVFIQLPMVCVTFSEKSYSVPIHTCAHSKSPPLPNLNYIPTKSHPSNQTLKKSLVFKNEKWHMYTLELKNELKFIWILWLLLLICNHKEMCCKTCLNAS